MANFHIINQVDIGHDGPVAYGPNEIQKIHLAQGDMDGACGPYSIMMGLMICGLIDRDDLVSLKKVDGRTNAGKLLNMLEKYQGLFRGGLYDHELVELLKRSYSRNLNVNPIKGTGVEIRKKVVEYLKGNCPVILGIDYGKDEGHWVVAIGYEYDYDEQEQKAKRLLLLDPGKPAPIISAWNGVVDSVGDGGRYPYILWGEDYKVSFSDSLALCPK